MTASTRRLDPQCVAGPEAARSLGGKLLERVLAGLFSQIATGSAGGALGCAAGAMTTPFGQEREVHRSQRLDLANEAVAAAPPAVAA
jgi:hypothetical protein